MPEIFEIKTRIDGLKSIHNITYAMQIVTISRLKRITLQLQKLNNSYGDAKKMLGKVLAEYPNFENRFFSLLETEKKSVFVLFFSNRGFCGSFNQDIYNAYLNFSKDNNILNSEILGIGKKSTIVLKENAKKFYIPQKDLFSSDEINEPLADILSLIQNGHPVYFVYTKFKSIISQKIVVDKIFPFDKQNYKDVNIRQRPVIFEPHAQYFQEHIKNIYLKLRFLCALQDSSSSEFSQRFLLMKSAVDNVKSLLDELHLQLNKERQRMITQEILEIISTFNALSKK